ncbi:MAG TPA: S46 family peptidase [Bacteroidales bacterium]|nr:S46 family peptidase [Bacteroidales bacterium]
MKRLMIIIGILSLSLSKNLLADEGMWLPILLEAQYDDMVTRGLKLSPEEIYSINNSSLKDAVVLFGSGCTGAIVSEQGLVITNHHCGYGSIAKVSTVDNDYLTNGYWSQDFKEEIYISGLTISRLINMRDVTDEILSQIPANATEQQRKEIVSKISKNIAAENKTKPYINAVVREFNYGNAYYLMTYEVFSDIRFVAAPPLFIGNFGGDTDNWVWPRHTGDFSIFRIYVDHNNEPANYSENNVPYKPKYVAPVSKKGVNKDDFIFVYGFPGSTTHFMTSKGIDMNVNHINPIAIDIRTTKLNIIENASQHNDTIRLMYANKRAGIANYWKKMQGETIGINAANAIEKRYTEEQKFINWLKNIDSLKKYSNLLDTIYQYHQLIYDYEYVDRVLYEAYFSNEITKLIQRTISNIKDLPKNEIDTWQNKWCYQINNFLKNNNLKLEQNLFNSTFKYLDSLSKYFPDEILKIKANANKYLDKSIFTNIDKISELCKKNKINSKTIQKDPLYLLTSELLNWYAKEIWPMEDYYNNKLDSLYRIYTRLQSYYLPPNKYYYDANSTMRIAYGNVKPYNPADAITYLYYTTINGMVDKALWGEAEDYKIDSTLLKLYKTRNFGSYTNDKGELPIAFISTAHTTGGNSGSPVFNGKGELIGLNYDRVWEGTMSDFNFDDSRCRNIVLDIRYMLFIIDKYANAQRILNEIKIVQ